MAKGLQQLVFGAESAGTRLDLYLARHFREVEDRNALSRAVIQRLIRDGQITLNGQKTKSSVWLKTHDRIEIRELPPRDVPVEAENIPLEILYEDADCLVINKAPGIVVHPAAGRSGGTLVNALLHYCPDLSGIGGERRPGIVHRLDKDTSGAIIIAKSAFAYQQLARQFKDRTVRKEYLALVWGKVSPEKGIIDRPIGRHRSDRKRMSSLHAIGKTREAVTLWEVVKYYSITGEGEIAGFLSLLRLMPKTGRTHQIRVHLADLGYPLVGDRVYQRKKRVATDLRSKKSWLERFPRQVLHAESLTLCLTPTGAVREFHAPLPNDIKKLLEQLEQQSADGSVHFVTMRG